MRHPTRPNASRRSSDDGFSFVETVITVILMSIVVVPILNAVIVSIRSSSVSHSAAQVETALVNAADRVNRAPKTCDYTMYAQAAVQTQGWPPGQANLTQYWYKPGTDPTRLGTWTQGPSSTPACEIATPTDGLVQKVQIQITSPNGKVTRSIEVVKSDV